MYLNIQHTNSKKKLVNNVYYLVCTRCVSVPSRERRVAVGRPLSSVVRTLGDCQCDHWLHLRLIVSYYYVYEICADFRVRPCAFRSARRGISIKPRALLLLVCRFCFCGQAFCMFRESKSIWALLYLAMIYQVPPMEKMVDPSPLPFPWRGDWGGGTWAMMRRPTHALQLDRWIFGEIFTCFYCCL